MRLYKWYSPKNVNHPVSIHYAVSLSSKRLLVSLGDFSLFPELYIQVLIGVSNETV